MNDVITTIRERRSIRKYRPDALSRELLEQIIGAGLYAPSARNKQPWHFTALSGLDYINALNAEVKAATARMPDNPYFAFVGTEQYHISYQAPVFVLVSANPEETSQAAADCALALGNMFLAARALGIGSCWINQLGPLSAEPGFRAVLDTLGVPQGHVIYGCGAFGYPDGDWPSAPARKPGAVTYVQ